jgi:hypothetical protein
MPITLDIFEAALFLRARTETVSGLAASGELPATCVDSNWIFLEEDLVNYLRGRIARETHERRQRAINAFAGRLLFMVWGGEWRKWRPDNFPMRISSFLTLAPAYPHSKIHVLITIFPNTDKQPRIGI